MRITEVDLDAGVDREVGVPVHLLALVPGDRLEELLGEMPNRSAHGYIPFDGEAANLFFQLVSARYERASVVVTSNKPFG
jgi:hypothetical protein